MASDRGWEGPPPTGRSAPDGAAAAPAPSAPGSTAPAEGAAAGAGREPPAPLEAVRQDDERAMASLGRVAQAAASAPDAVAFLDRAAADLAALLGGATAVALLDAGGSGALVRVGAAPRPLAGVRLEVADPRPGTEGGGLAMDALPDPLRAELQAAGAVAARTLPLRFRSEQVGVLLAGYRDPEAGPGRADRVAAGCAAIAAALASDGVRRDLRARDGELALLHDVSVASSALDPALLLDEALRRIAGTLRADAAAGYLASGGELAPAARSGMSAETARAAARLPPDAGPAGEAYADRRIVRWSEAAAASGGAAAWATGGDRIEVAAAAPLLARSRRVGAIVLARRRREEFTAAELSILPAIGVQLGVAVENARLLADARRRVADLEAVNALALRLVATPPDDVRGLLTSTCREIARALGARSAVVLRVDEAGTRLLGVAGHGTPLPPATLAIPLDRSELAARALRDQEPVWGLHVFDAPPPDGEPGPPPLSLLIVPLTSRRSRPGVVAVADDADRRYGDAEVALACALAGEAAMAIENAELYAEAQRRVEELSLVNEVGRKVAASLDLDHVLREGASIVRRLVAAGHGHVLLLDAGRRELRLAATTTDQGDAQQPRAIPLDGPSVGAASVRERRPVAVQDVTATDPAAVPVDCTPGACSALAAPLLVHDQPVGALVVTEHERSRRFTAAEIERVMAVANHLAVAIDNGRLFGETRRRAEELGLVLEVGRSLGATLELDAVLDAGVRNLSRLIDAPGAALLLVDPPGATLTVRAVSGPYRDLLGRSLPLDGRSVAAATVAERGPVVVEDASGGAPPHPGLLASTAGRAYLGVPLVVRERAIGACVIVETRGRRRFTAAELERAGAIANQLAVAVENARLYDDLRRSYADLAQAQEQLVRKERLAALGELSAVVAHEVRNPLGVIFNSLGSLRRLVQPKGDAKLLLDIVGEEADRLNRIVGALLDFANPSPPALRPERLDAVLEAALSTALVEGGERITLARSVAGDLPPVPMDARLVRQALLNVALNAVQAMPHGGTLSVRARVEGRSALVEIADTGTGVAPEVRARIFEPFFTTKPTGTGLGLAVVKRIVDDHRGSVDVRPAPSGGTVVAVRLPLDADDRRGRAG